MQQCYLNFEFKVFLQISFIGRHPFLLNTLHSFIFFPSGITFPLFLFSRLPDDVWLINLDSSRNCITPPSGCREEVPPLPEPECSILKNHLNQVCIIQLQKDYYHI